mmetsp:Transcript_65882/g.183551  ORF Transcript_65882/g.183551 Transcript_65882/m.183551 type:complete len:120 (-) Transcript_65882:399-758(-)
MACAEVMSHSGLPRGVLNDALASSGGKLSWMRLRSRLVARLRRPRAEACDEELLESYVSNSVEVHFGCEEECVLVPVGKRAFRDDQKVCAKALKFDHAQYREKWLAVKAAGDENFVGGG